jgi:hypothetical protein
LIRENDGTPPTGNTARAARWPTPFPDGREDIARAV